MGYRTFKHEPHEPRRTMQVTATPLRIYVPNSGTAYVKIPCFYQEVKPPMKMRPHNRPLDDHMGWPDPRRADGSCQLYEPFEAGIEPSHTTMGGHPPVSKLLDMDGLIPIHFKDEGYRSLDIAWSKSNPTSGKPDGRAFFDEEQDWVIYLIVGVTDKSDPQEEAIYKFSLWADGDPGLGLVTTGEIVLLPAAPVWKE